MAESGSSVGLEASQSTQINLGARSKTKHSVHRNSSDQLNGSSVDESGSKNKSGKENSGKSKSNYNQRSDAVDDSHDNNPEKRKTHDNRNYRGRGRENVYRNNTGTGNRNRQHYQSNGYGNSEYPRQNRSGGYTDNFYNEQGMEYYEGIPLGNEYSLQQMHEEQYHSNSRYRNEYYDRNRQQHSQQNRDGRNKPNMQQGNSLEHNDCTDGPAMTYQDISEKAQSRNHKHYNSRGAYNRGGPNSHPSEKSLESTDCTDGASYQDNSEKSQSRSHKHYNSRVSHNRGGPNSYASENVKRQNSRDKNGLKHSEESSKAKQGAGASDKKINNVPSDKKIDNDDKNHNTEIAEENEELNKDSNITMKELTAKIEKLKTKGRKVTQAENECQRDSLVEQLEKNSYECMVCCNVIRRDTAIWTCDGCFHMFHMYCIKKWAKSSMCAATGQDQGNAGWRCPACQKVCQQWPLQYTCFCGKQKNPASSQHMTPHSCGELCGKSRGKSCTHACTLLCHPGPCPDCQAFVTRFCLCGKSSRSTRCCNAEVYKCDAPCNKTLNCGRHSCAAGCHGGPCEPCGVMIEQKCYCGKVLRSVLCGSAESFSGAYSCKEICGGKLDCGEHTCTAVCHPGACEPCTLQPALQLSCACGQTLLKDLRGVKKRDKCTDPIPCCDKICDKILPCGPDVKRHHCKEKCHSGPCPPCEGVMSVECQCGSMMTEMPCKDALSHLTIVSGPGGDGERRSGYKCTRRCNKKMTCSRHRCSQNCCVSTEHKCLLICGYKLSCGLHKCEELCHKGNCGSCWHVSFDELRCYCGAEVTYPPVPCGTKPPECRNKCTRQHACSHPVLHNCHSEEKCPQCTALTEKWCMGRHELRRNIPCYLTDISCGLQCNKPLPCGQHRCITVCHKGPCLSEGESCTQPCQLLRAECGHPCLAPCHPGSPCPTTQCKAEILLKCDCGRREEKALCMQVSEARAGTADYNKMAAQIVAAKLWESQSIDVTVLSKELGSNKRMKKLPCNADCAVQERNQRLALALEIKNPDLSAKLGNPTYPQFLKDYAKQNAAFVAKVEESLSQLVTSAQQPKVTKKSHSFKSMPSVQRRVIHELAPFYGCTTESYDEEPNKNVVATAVKDKCWHPTISLTSQVQREMFPKAPVPVPINSKEEDIRTAVQASKQSTQIFTSSSKSSSTKPGGKKEKEIDYFDMTD